MSNNWWANKLGTQQPAPRQEMPLPPSQIPMTPMPGTATPFTGNNPYANQTTSGQQPYLPSSGNATSCPSCRSKNYMKVGSQVTQGGAVDAWRCYDCGYPKVQTGTGIAGVNAPSAGPTQAAIQVPTGGWNPTTIIGKL